MKTKCKMNNQTWVMGTGSYFQVTFTLYNFTIRPKCRTFIDKIDPVTISERKTTGVELLILFIATVVVVNGTLN